MRQSNKAFYQAIPKKEKTIEELKNELNWIFRIREKVANIPPTPLRQTFTFQDAKESEITDHYKR
jgi:hypothetical protein